MGIGFVLLVFTVLGLIAASIGAIVMVVGLAGFRRRLGKNYRQAVSFVLAYPFACLAWAGVVFIFQATVNGALLGRDPGISDGFWCPLPNGYAISAIDTTDTALVYNPKTSSGSGEIKLTADSVPDVRQMQVADRYILAAAESNAWKTFGTPSESVDQFFLLDTQNRRQVRYSTQTDLGDAAAKLGIVLKLQTMGWNYRHYRFTWFDAFAGLVLVTGLLVGFVFLVRSVRKLAGESDL